MQPPVSAADIALSEPACAIHRHGYGGSRATITTTIPTVVAAAAALKLVSSAPAAREPKNELPFTNAVGAQNSETLTASLRHTVHTLAHAGEPKTQLPSTRR